MADLSNFELKKIEKYLEMRSGYVLDFNNTTFEDFIMDSISIEIYNEKYLLPERSGSKANRLRALFKIEKDYTVGKVITDLIEYWDSKNTTNFNAHKAADTPLRDECLRIANRLKSGTAIEHIDAIKPITNDKDFATLASSIRELINKNQPEAALDRLHTFTVKYIRELCDRHGVPNDKNKSLHSMYGEYIKKLKDMNAIQSIMSERILKTSISILEAFNDVRNNQSFAHDNPLLNHSESVLIFNSVSSTIRFIEDIEKRLELANKKANNIDVEWSDLPF